MTVASRPASESEATALSVQPDDKSAPKTTGKARDIPEGEFKIADLGEDGVVYVKLPDGRHVAATVKDGVDVRRGTKVKLTGDGDDYDNAVVTGTVS